MKISLKKPYYGWIIVALGIVIMAASVGIVNNCMSLYIVPICDETGFSRKAVSVLNTLLSVGSMAVAAVSAELYHHFSVRRTMQVSAVVISVGYFAFSFANKLWQFYAICVVVACALWLLAYIPFAVILSNWFHKRTGFVIGLTYMGTGVGGMIFSPIIGSLIANVGWRQAMVTMAIVMAAVHIPCTSLLRDRPEDMGLEPYGAQEEKEQVQHRDTLPGIPFDSGRHGAKFILIALAVSVLCFANTGFCTNLPAHMSDKGYSIETASRIMSATMASLAIGKISLGWIYDKFGSKFATALAGLMLAACPIAGIFLPGVGPIVCIVVCFSLGMAFGSVGIPIVAREAFGLRDFDRYNGALNAVTGVLSAAAPVFSGFIYDATGSYTPAFIAVAAASVVFTAVLVLCLRDKQSWECTA